LPCFDILLASLYGSQFSFKPAYHSKFNEAGFSEACSCAILPIKTSIRGPAPQAEADQEDIIDETLHYFRANVLFRNYFINGSADRTLIYLTLHAVQCLVKCEKIDDKASALRELKTLSKDRPFSCPGDGGFPLNGMFPASANKSDADMFKSYMKQAREELAIRLCDKLFDERDGGAKSKWWQSFSKRKFMGKELNDGR
jgi:actin related protein 2/3 complex, subunit 3